jgi:hypothetical protein
MISWVLYMYLSLGFSSIHWLTLWDPRLRHLSLFTCRMDVLGWRTWPLMISVFCLEWLRYSGSPYTRFMVFKSLCSNVTSSPTLWAFSYTLFMLTWNVKLLLCSLDLVPCIIIALSCILLLVRLNLFAALCHNALVMIHICSIMVFISGVYVTFSWLISTPASKWVA